MQEVEAALLGRQTEELGQCGMDGVALAQVGARFVWPGDPGDVLGEELLRTALVRGQR
jgi:hypothetical protein